VFADLSFDAGLVEEAVTDDAAAGGADEVDSTRMTLTVRSGSTMTRA